MTTQPTDLPRGDRRTVRVILPMQPPRPTTVDGVLLAAARIIHRNGLWVGDVVEDALNRRGLATPMRERRMSIVGAIRCAVAGDPQKESPLAELAINFLSLSLGGDDEPVWRDPFSLAAHVDQWGDVAAQLDVVAFLELAATAPERAA
ncbi:hypothetical protein [Streptomyces sp. NPDC101132]|uniref:DUF6197 family protein n=1 Tax=Streptomyces sp. NPDC101132 TaxID=3366110 RepID=UPI0038249611